MDAEGCVEKHIARNIIDITDEVATPLNYDIPRIVFEAPGIIVILKPAGWETDVYDVAKFGIPITPVARFYLLSTFIGGVYPKEEFPICHAPSHSFGFVHRLDQMSSGLIVAATTFESFLFMQWQMSSYSIERQYYVLCHGLLRSHRTATLTISARILEGQVRLRHRSAFGERCRVDEEGKPALSNVTLTSCLGFKRDRGAFSAVAIDIFTGRQHQIRTHLQYIGHPSVYDGRYVMQDVLLQGLCVADVAFASTALPRPRPLPERHRAELELRGAYPW